MGVTDKEISLELKKIFRCVIAVRALEIPVMKTRTDSLQLTWQSQMFFIGCAMSMAGHVQSQSQKPIRWLTQLFQLPPNNKTTTNLVPSRRIKCASRRKGCARLTFPLKPQQRPPPLRTPAATLFGWKCLAPQWTMRLHCVINIEATVAGIVATRYCLSPPAHTQFSPSTKERWGMRCMKCRVTVARDRRSGRCWDFFWRAGALTGARNDWGIDFVVGLGTEAVCVWGVIIDCYDGGVMVKVHGRLVFVGLQPRGQGWPRRWGVCDQFLGKEGSRQIW